MNEPKSFGFGLQTLRKRKEIVPLVAIVGAVCVGIVAFSSYSLMRKSDIAVNRRITPAWERIDPEKRQKLITINQEYKKIPELEALKKEMKSYDSSQK